MAFEFLESWDWQHSSGEPSGQMNLSGWYGAAFNSGIAGTLGGRRLQWNGGGNVGRWGRQLSATQGKSFGFHITVPSLGTAQNYLPFWFFYDVNGGQQQSGGTLGQFGFDFSPDGKVRAYRATSNNGARTLLGESAAGVIVQGVETAIEGELFISTTVGRFKLWVNNVVVLNLTGVNTQAQAASLVNGFFSSLSGSGYVLEIDDFWMADTDVKPTASPMRATVLLPTTDGATLTMTPSTGTVHKDMVNEQYQNLMVADWLMGDAVGELSVLGLPDLPKTPNEIYAVQLLTYANKSDIAARSISLGFEHGGTISDGPNYPLSTTQQMLKRITTTNGSGAAWSKADIDAMSLRLKVAS